MNSKSRPDAAAVLERRERERALATLVRKRLSTGFSDPDDDLVVDQLTDAVRSMQGPLRRALIGRIGGSRGRKLLARFLDGECHGRDLERVRGEFDRQRLLPLADRTVAYHDLVVQATRALLASPLPVWSVSSEWFNDRLIFPDLVADLLRNESQPGGRPIETAPDMGYSLPMRDSTSDIYAELALAVLKRARRDRRRYDVAVTSKHKVTPLIVPGNRVDREPHPDSHRERFVLEVSWAIPSEEALSAIGELGPIVEVGAGSGYWAQLLRERGVDILAFDQEPDPQYNHEHIARRWGPVAKAPSTIAAEYPNRALLLIWPPRNEPMAHRALQSYRGNTVAYIGERGWSDENTRPDAGPLSGDRAFHQLLDEQWEEYDVVGIPTWRHLDDCLYIFHRKS